MLFEETTPYFKWLRGNKRKGNVIKKHWFRKINKTVVIAFASNKYYKNHE